MIPPVELRLWPASGERLVEISPSLTVLVNPAQVVILLAHTAANKTCRIITTAAEPFTVVIVMGSRDEVAAKLFGLEEGT